MPIFINEFHTLNNQDKLQTNSAVHVIRTGNKYYVHRPVDKRACFLKRTYCAGIRIFNSLPCRPRSLTNMPGCKQHEEGTNIRIPCSLFMNF